MRELARNDEAFVAYSKAMSLDPNMAEAHAGCGNMLAALKRFDEAIKAYDKALAIATGLEFVESERLHCKMRLCDWSNFSVYLQRLTGISKTRKLDAHPFEFLSMSSSEQEQLEGAKAWVARKYPRANTPIWRGEPYKHDRIRLAYVSSDFREHATSYLAAGMFECHDKSRFEVTAVSIGADDRSDMRRRVQSSFEHFIDASKLDDDEIARVMKYRSYDGEPYRNTVDDVLTQMYGHSLYHRGQIASLVRAAGGTPAATDFIFWTREQIAASELETRS